MSRTYRNTSIKHGKPKRSYTHFNQDQENNKNIACDLIKHRPKRYEIKTYTRQHEYDRWYPTAEAISRCVFVPKGTPLAIPEIMPEWPYHPTGRWLIPPQPWTTTHTYRQRMWNGCWQEEHGEYERKWVFRHVHINRTGARGSNAHRWNKRERVRDIRREGKAYLLKWEDEYHLNQDQEPFNWVLDNPWDHEDYYIGLYDDCDDWQDYSDTEILADYEDFYDPYEYLYWQEDYDYFD